MKVVRPIYLPLSMKIWVVTGGAACGKSHLCKILKSCYDKTTIFSSDEAVTQLLFEEDVKNEIALNLGQYLLLEDGNLDKKALRAAVFSDENLRLKLESILHPRVFAQLELMARKLALESEMQLLIAEVPLFYESKHELTVDLTIVVATGATVQMKRLIQERGLEASIAKGLLQAQMPLKSKMELADIVIWNEGSEEALKLQAQILMQQIPA